MSNNTGHETEKSGIDPKPAEALLKPAPDQLSESELEQAAGGSSGWGGARPTTPTQGGV